MTVTYHSGRRIQGNIFQDSYWKLYDSAVVNMGSTLGNEGTGAWTHSVWHKADSTDSVTVYNKYGASGADVGFYLAGTQGGNGYYFYDLDYPTYHVELKSGVQPRIGEWDHIVITRSSSGVFKIYVNGVFPTHSNNTQTSTNSIDNSSDWIFANHTAGDSNIADFTLWERELTASEILSIYENGNDSISQTGLIHHYNFEQTGTSLTDQVGSINGTRSGGETGLTRDVQDYKPTDVQIGSRYEETNTRKMYYRMDSDYETAKWFELGTVPYAGGRGVFAGGYSGSNINVIDYITIATTGNATDFGDMAVSRRNSGVCSNKTRGLMCGGYTSSDQPSNIIDYITIATPSNSTDFGDMDNTATNGIMGIGSETRALFGGGESGMTNRIAYVTIDTTSNSTDFGDLTVARKGGSSTGDGTKGIWMGGEISGTQGNVIDYVTISTTGNAVDWGDLSSPTASGSIGLVSNGTIGLLVTGGSYSDRVDKKTIATNANSVDYGDLTDGRSQAGQCSTETRAVFAGGKYQSGSSSSRNIIDYMAIATGGNATDFGDLTAARYIMGGMSDTGAVRP
jgi:hypothetical protein